ncbi:hypothetical protein H5410_059665 [Solanum commersonii]|uniref:Uncharacterized protein n=1 Tax=Solanum commersonii TaxID=4109 RepID=A0A9J5W302_SOLCO|nr:hypothetical protein H5410_059665 [Solanum commersonii]
MLCSNASSRDAGLRVCQQWQFETMASWSYATQRVSHLGDYGESSPWDILPICMRILSSKLFIETSNQVIY